MNLEFAKRIVELSLFEYSKVRAQYWEDMNTAMHSYLTQPTSDDNWFRTISRVAVTTAFADAVAVAWTDSGSKQELGIDVLAFLAANQAAEFGYLESLLLSLRLLKTSPLEEEEEQEDRELELLEEASHRADGYARTLDRIYNNAKVMGAGEQILIFTGSDGLESCFDCQKYKGLRHPAWWWIRHDAVPPNRRFECKGYNCWHVLEDSSGRLFTI